jgi:hypothetical protein
LLKSGISQASQKHSKARREKSGGMMRMGLRLLAASCTFWRGENARITEIVWNS